MRNKKVKLLSVTLSLCMLGTFPTQASEFSDGFIQEETAEKDTFGETDADEALPEPETSDEVEDGSSEEAEDEFSEDGNVDFSDGADEDEFSSEAAEATEDETFNLGGILNGTQEAISGSIVEADIPVDSSLATTCNVYTGNNLEYQDYPIWSAPISSYLVQSSSGNMMRVQADAIENKLLMEYYDSSYNIKKTMTLDLALPEFGGFYESGDNYYVLTGAENESKDDSKEVFNVSKYSKDWKFEGSCGLFGANTAIPFRAGSARMVMNGKYLFIRTCHEMYNGHQANVTFSVDTSNMSVVDSFTGVWNTDNGYVSHSFNQFIQIDNGVLVGSDHGDGYPRAISAYKYPTDISNGFFAPKKLEEICKQYDFMTYPGSDNYTGASQGGFEYSDSFYLVAGNCDTNGMGSARNVFVSSVPKDGGKAVIRYFSDYAGTDDDATTPQFIKIGTNSFILMWSSRGYVYYTTVDGTGQQTGATYKMAGNLSDCVPSVINGKLTWYTWTNEKNTFYDINLSNLSENHAVRILNGHKYVYSPDVKDGYTTKKCSVCGDEGKVAVPISVEFDKLNVNGSYVSVTDSCFMEIGKVYNLEWDYLYADIPEDMERVSGIELINSDDGILSIEPKSKYSVNITPLKAGKTTLTLQCKYNPEISCKLEVGVNLLDEKYFTFSMRNNSSYYDGEEHKPTFYIYNDFTTLKEGTDYSLSYKGDLVNVGKPAVVVTGIGKYSGVVEKEFEIKAFPISNVKYSLVAKELNYNGYPQEPEVILKKGEQQLVKDKDYTVECINNITPGRARVGINGIGNYYGYFTLTFYIVRGDISEYDISLPEEPILYDGSEKCPAIKVSSGGKELTENKDYVVSYKNNTNVGSASVSISGKGYIYGNITKEFQIQPADISKLSIELSNDTYIYDGKAKEPKITVKNGNVQLNAETDYTVLYADNIKAGTATVTVKGKGNYTGSASKNFKIKMKELDKLTADLSANPSKSAISGSQVKLTANANGGTGKYTYKFLICDDKGNWFKIRDFESSNTCTWTPGAAGKKTLYVDVKDSAGTVKRVELSYEVEKKVEALTAKLTADPSSSVVSGKTVKLTASATGGSGKYTYKFLVCDAKGNWYRIRDFESSNTCTWIPGAAGKKTLYVDVKDSAGTVKRVELSYEVEKKVEALTAKLTADPSSSVVSGKTVKLTASATGGSGKYTYKFLVCDAKGNWYRIRDFESSNTCTWTPGAAGKKTLYVDVKDSAGTVKRAELSYEVEKKVEALTAKLTVEPPVSAVSGKTVKLTASATGGSGKYTYKFLVCDAKGNWYRIRDFESSNTCTWIPGAAGKKTLYVDVKDSAGTVKRTEVPYEVKTK